MLAVRAAISRVGNSLSDKQLQSHFPNADIQQTVTKVMTWLGVTAALSLRKDQTTTTSCKVCFPASDKLLRCLKNSPLLLPEQQIPSGTAEQFAGSCFPDLQAFEDYAFGAFNDATFVTRISLTDALKGCACKTKSAT